MKTIESESKLTFLEATSIIVGHGVGSGVLAVPYLASRNSWSSFIVIMVVVYGVNLLLHFMIAELSLNNRGAQFITIFEKELFKGKIGSALSWVAFLIMGFSVLVNVAGFISGGGAVFTSWFSLSPRLSQLLYYLLATLVVYLGMKAVGIAEKISVFSMVGVIGIIFVSVLIKGTNPLPSHFVMSVPQVVKGVDGDVRKIRGAIGLGTGINLLLVFIITLMTLIGMGGDISQNGALVDLSGKLGGWVGIVGYLFSLLALSTSFWANTLNLRDIVSEKTGWNNKISWFASSFPCLVLALLGLEGFVGFTRLAGIVQVLTGLGVICAYNISRRRIGESKICGVWGKLPFQILVVAGSIAATLGSLIKVV